MATLADIHGAIAGRLESLNGVRAFPNPGQGVTPPAAWVQLAEWAQEAFGRQGPRELTFNVYVFTAQSVRPQDGYSLLMEFADFTGTRSIGTAIWDGNNRTTGTFTGTYAGTTYTCARTQATVTGFRVLGAQEVDEFQMYGGVFTVSVHTST